MEAIKGSTSALTISRAKKAVTTTSTNVSNEGTLQENQNGPNSHRKLCQKWKVASNVHMGTRRQKDDKFSLNCPNLWLGNNANEPQDHQRINGNCNTANLEDN